MDDGQINPPNTTYRVVGISAGKFRHVVLGGMTLERAEVLRDRLLTASAFSAVEIEPEKQ